MKTAGLVLLVLGIIGLAIFGIQAFNDSESFSILGLDIAVSKANWAPVITSAVVLIIGLVLMALGKRRS